VTDPGPEDLTEDEIALLRVWRTSTPGVRARLEEAVLKSFSSKVRQRSAARPRRQRMLGA
jgi:hypothetical protein